MDPHDLHSKTLSLFVTVAGDDGVFGLSFSLLLASPLPQVAHFPISIHIHSFGRSAKECAIQAGFHENSNSIYFWDRFFSIRKWCWTQFAHRPSMKSAQKNILSRRLHIWWIIYTDADTHPCMHTQLNHFNPAAFLLFLYVIAPHILKCVCARMFMCHWHNLRIVRMHKIRWKYILFHRLLDV